MSRAHCEKLQEMLTDVFLMEEKARQEKKAHRPESPLSVTTPLSTTTPLSAHPYPFTEKYRPYLIKAYVECKRRMQQ